MVHLEMLTLSCLKAKPEVILLRWYLCVSLYSGPMCFSFLVFGRTLPVAEVSMLQLGGPEDPDISTLIRLLEANKDSSLSEALLSPINSHSKKPVNRLWNSKVMNFSVFLVTMSAWLAPLLNPIKITSSLELFFPTFLEGMHIGSHVWVWK